MFLNGILHIKKSRWLLLIALSLVIWLAGEYAWAQWQAYDFRRYAARKSTAIIQPVKVFQIGFSKCGTVTLDHFFNRNGIPGVHHDGGRLPLSMHKNYQQGLPFLSPQYAQFLVFTDMEMLYKEPQVSIGMQYFKELDQQYPGSKFILNTRNKAAWLKSRSLQPILPTNDNLLKVSAELLHITQDAMLQRWSQEWDEHHRAVLEYFKNRPNDLLVFHIEQDPPEKLVEFFKDHFRLSPELYAQENRTAFRKLTNLWYRVFNRNIVVKLSNETITLPPKTTTNLEQK